jgi:lipid A ethanolaminephosphotransferase
MLPALLVAGVRLPRRSLPCELGAIGGSVAGGIALIAVLILALSAHFATFLREHKPLRYLLAPMNVIYGSARHGLARARPARELADVAGPVERLANPTRRPVLLFLVIGETARAANFELGGYERPTTPRLHREPGVIYFERVRACGTSTATSVPCIFSHLGRARFDVEIAAMQTNLLDTVQRAGIDVEWRDNNSGCKGVCGRVPTVLFGARHASLACDGRSCFDEVMLEGLEARLRNLEGDAAVVFHQLGSHGPAYSERYPPDFEVFRPSCRSADLGACSRESIVNAHDNTIAYTDYNLDLQIELLKRLSGDFDTVLLYVSDHGESLGEHGLYLHGAPYFMAPEEQTHVPLVLWMSEGYRASQRIAAACLHDRAREPASHDDIYHTVLGLLGIRTAAYRAEHDLISRCRQAIEAPPEPLQVARMRPKPDA